MSLKDCLAAISSMPEKDRVELYKEFEDLGLLKVKWMGASWKYDAVDRLLKHIDRQCEKSALHRIELAKKLKKGDISRWQYDDAMVSDEVRNLEMLQAVQIGECANGMRVDQIIEAHSWKEKVKFIEGDIFENKKINLEWHLSACAAPLIEEFIRRYDESLRMIARANEMSKKIESGEYQYE